jgi:Sec-independent protein translocase protein TatA
VRILSQQLPQLLGSFGAVGAVAGVGIGVALPVLAAVFKGTKKAEEATRDLMEVYKELKDAYTEINQQQLADQRKMMEDEEALLKNRLSAADREASIRNGNSGLDLARERAGIELEALQQRIQLGAVERILANATGSDAVRLAKERLDIIEKIRMAEEAITENGRKQQLATAQSNLTKAETKLQASKDSEGGSVKEAGRLRGEIAKLEEESEKVKRGRLATIEYLTERLKELEKKTDETLKKSATQLALGNPVEAARLAATAGAQKLGQGGIKKDIEEAKFISREEVDLTAQRDVLQRQLDILNESLKESANAQKEAAAALTAALDQLSLTKQNQNIERNSVTVSNQTKQAGDISTDVTATVGGELNRIKQTAEESGQPLSPIIQENIGQAEKLLNDSVPDGQQAAQLASLLQQIANNLTANNKNLEGGLNDVIKIIKDLAGKYTKISGEITTLKGQINQLK